MLPSQSTNGDGLFTLRGNQQLSYFTEAWSTMSKGDEENIPKLVDKSTPIIVLVKKGTIIKLCKQQT